MRVILLSAFISVVPAFASDLSFDPPVVNVTATAGAPGDQTQKLKVTLLNNGSATGFSVFTDQPWIDLQTPSGTIGFTQAVDLNFSVISTAFEAGTYKGNIIVTTADGVTAMVPIVLLVQGIVLQANPPTMAITLVAGTSTTLSSTVKAADGSPGVVLAQRGSGGTWLSASYTPTNGVLPVTVNVTADASLLPPGVVVGTVLVACVSGSACVPKEITVTLTVVGRANFTVNPASVPLAGDTSSGPLVQAVTIFNTGADATYTATVVNAPWLSVSPATALVKTNQSANLNLSANPAGLDPGTYTGTVRFDGPGSSVTVAVTLAVAGIKLSTSSVTLAALSGNKATATFDVTGTEPFTITRATGGPWLTFSPSSGTAPAKITVTADSATLPTGLSQGSLVVACTTSCASRTVTVQFTVSALTLVSSADYKSGLAAGSIAAVFAPNIATATQVGSLPLLNTIGGVSIDVKDSTGKVLPAGLFFVSQNQVNFEVPETAAAGPAVLTIRNAGGVFATANFNIETVAPAIYTANAQGTGPPAAYVVTRLIATDDYQLAATCDSNNNCTPVPIDVTRSPFTYLQLFGTGIRGRSDLSKVTAVIGKTAVGVLYAGPQLGFPGLDQVNVALPSPLVASGIVTLVLTVDGKPAQPVTLNIK